MIKSDTILKFLSSDFHKKVEKILFFVFSIFVMMLFSCKQQIVNMVIENSTAFDCPCNIVAINTEKEPVIVKANDKIIRSIPFGYTIEVKNSPKHYLEKQADDYILIKLKPTQDITIENKTDFDIKISSLPFYQQNRINAIFPETLVNKNETVKPLLFIVYKVNLIV